MRIRKSICYELFAILIAIFPLLNVYRLGPLPMGDIIAIFFLPLLLSRKSLKLNTCKNEKWYVLFLIYSFSSIIIGFFYVESIELSGFFGKIFHLVFYFIFGIVLAKKYLRIEYLKNVIIKISILLSGCVLLEWVLAKFLKIEIYAIVPFFKLNYSVTNYSDYVRLFSSASLSQGYRPSGLFLEPAHYCAYAIIGLVLLLSKNNIRKIDFFGILIIVSGILMSKSTGGIICAIVCFGYYIFFLHETKLSIKIAFVLVGLAFIVNLCINDDGLILLLSSRISEIGSNVYDTSGNRRVLRGLYVWRELPNITKVLGCGVGMLEPLIQSKGIMVLTDSSFSEEMNMIFYLICSFGIIGSVLYICSFILNFLNSDHTRKMLIFVYLFLGIYSNYIFHALSIVFIALIFISEKDSSMIKNNAGKKQTIDR